MFKKMQYVIKTVNGENTQELQNLLNEMSMNGWELYSMHEVETDDGFVCNCIFMSEMTGESRSADKVDITTFRSQMEKMLSPELDSYELCLDIQNKIRLKEQMINLTKSELENEAHPNRKKLNDKISAGLKELEELRGKLAKVTSPDQMYEKLTEEKLAVCLSGEITRSTDDLIAQTVKLRLKLTEELGYVVPRILFCDDEGLLPGEFSIKVRGGDAVKGFVYPEHKMYFADELKLDKTLKNSVCDVDIITGKDVVWIEMEQCKSFWSQGLTAAEYIARALEHAAIKYVDELLDYEELDKYIEVVSRKNAFLVENVIPDFVTAADLRFVLTNLIRERVCVKDISYIFEKLNDFAQEATRFDLLNKLRLALSRRICQANMNEDGVIEAFEISEKSLKDLSPDFEDGDVVKIDADAAEKFVNKLQKAMSKVSEPRLIVPMEMRHLMFMLLSNYTIDVTVLSREEIGCNAQVEIIAEI